MKDSNNGAQKRALIIGASGQDGTLLSQLLLGKGYKVYGVIRPGTVPNTRTGDLELHASDVAKTGIVKDIIQATKPDEIYHLAAYHQSSQERRKPCTANDTIKKTVDVSFGICYEIAQALLSLGMHSRLVFAGSSQMYSAISDISEVREDTQIMPSTFYGHVKGWGMTLLDEFRQKYGVNCCTAILFNHESSLRNSSFATRKITHAAAVNALGSVHRLNLMNIGARVDWSAAEDVVDALHIMGTIEKPQNLIIASGMLHSIRDLLSIAFEHVNLDWRKFTDYERDARDFSLCGNPSRIHSLGWKPKLSFSELVQQMVDNDLKILTRRD